jgi:spore photoproduct lyase
MGKDTLHLVRYAGEFLKPCPGTRNYICCGYQILNLAANCPMDCSYCILQAYFNQPNLRVFVNLHEGLKRALEEIDSHPERMYRVGTGEFTDSLALDPVVSWTRTLLPEFSRRKNAILELKTKTDRIQGVLSVPWRDRIVLSWSLNSSQVVSREEHGSATVSGRLGAAQRCQREGYVVGFHFDPMIPHPNWREGYLRTVDKLDTLIDPKRVIWISMGALRFMPGLKRVIRARHGGTSVLDGEFVTGLDGKMRYFKPIRLELYGFLRETLEKWHPDTGLYLCMESDEVWTRTMGWSPKDTAGLSAFLDGRVMSLFGSSVSK